MSKNHLKTTRHTFAIKLDPLWDVQENDQIDFISTDGDHLQFTEDFFEKEIVPYLN